MNLSDISCFPKLPKRLLLQWWPILDASSLNSQILKGMILTKVSKALLA